MRLRPDVVIFAVLLAGSAYAVSTQLHDAPDAPYAGGRAAMGSVVADFTLKDIGLRDRTLVGAQPQAPGGGEHDAAGPRIVSVRLALHQAPGGALVHQLAHRLLCDAGARRQRGQAAAGQRQMARDLNVGCAQTASRRKMRQGQRKFVVVGHQAQHTGVEALLRQRGQPAQVGVAPGGVGDGVRHRIIVNQID